MRKNKNVYFNDEKEANLLKFADGLPNFSDWVKERIKDAIGGSPPGQDIEKMIERIVEEKLKNRMIAPSNSMPEEVLATTRTPKDLKSKIGTMI